MKKFFDSFSKWIILIVLINGLAMMWRSYKLAEMGYSQIAENLSIQVCIIIISTCLGYYGKSCAENLSKHNLNWPSKRGRDEPL